jgi:hypothetical protein
LLNWGQSQYKGFLAVLTFLLTAKKQAPGGFPGGKVGSIPTLALSNFDWGLQCRFMNLLAVSVKSILSCKVVLKMKSNRPTVISVVLR